MKPSCKVLRIRLTDFLGHDLEECVIYVLDNIQQMLHFSMSVSLWYSEKDLDITVLESFKKRNIALIRNFNVQFYHLNSFEYPCWYDIIAKKDEHLLKKYQFRVIYDSADELPLKLIEFKNFIGYYNEKHNHNGINKLAKPYQNQGRSI